MPVQHDLRGCAALGLSHSLDVFVLEQALALADRTPSLGQNAVLGVVGAQLGLRELLTDHASLP
jgi:hypothetical protein